MNLLVNVESAEELEKPITKRLLFPDGNHRLITMKRSLWQRMEWLAENDGSGTIQLTIDIAYQMANEFHDPEEMTFEEQIRDCLKHSITGGVRAVLKNQKGLVQDNTASRHSQR